MTKDPQGQILSGATAEAAGLYDKAVRAFNLGYGDAPGQFEAAQEASPDFAMGIWRRRGCLRWSTIRACWVTPGRWFRLPAG